MKNANVFVDVDLTLVDANGRLLEGARESLQQLKLRGCHLFLWSSVGADYARKIASLHQLGDLFEAFVSKANMVIDDMPATAVAPFVFNVQDEESWPALADKISARHLD